MEKFFPCKIIKFPKDLFKLWWKEVVAVVVVVKVEKSFSVLQYLHVQFTIKSNGQVDVQKFYNHCPTREQQWRKWGKTERKEKVKQILT